MKVYLARLDAHQSSPHEIVGIFSARHENELFWLIDECTSPQDVEVAELASGGLYWEGPTTLTVPKTLTEEEEESEFDGIPGGGTVCGDWEAAIFDRRELEWRKVEWVD